MSSAVNAPHISKPILGFFRFIVRGYFRRHFHAVRVNGAEHLQAAAANGGPLIVYANHCSWWDPMVQVLLAAAFLPERQHYAPMDAAALQRYAIFKRIGVFGVEMKTPRGAAQFLRTGLAVLQAGGILWVTPQGRFADVRERPLHFKPGLAALAARVSGGCRVLPMAIEYPFWDERLPETLLHIGEPVTVAGESAQAIEDSLKTALSQAITELERMAIERNAGAFAVLQSGRVGTGGFYQLGQRFWARLRGRRFQAEHTALEERA